jgi:hypothetical protein
MDVRSKQVENGLIEPEPVMTGGAPCDPNRGPFQRPVAPGARRMDRNDSTVIILPDMADDMRVDLAP